MAPRTVLGALLERAFLAGVAAVGAEKVTRRYAAERWHDPAGRPRRVLVLALGKAAPSMARGLASALPGVKMRGVVVGAVPDEVPEGLELVIGSHPVPSEASLIAGARLLAAASSAERDERVIVLVSGGGSALAEVLRPGLTLEDLTSVTQTLLRSGAPIEDLNAVRRRLSRLKAGGLLASLSGDPPLTLVISDVVGDDPAVIASGPTMPPDAGLDDLAGLRRRRWWGQLAPHVQDILSIDPGRVSGGGGEFVMLANGRAAADAAAEYLRLAGCRAEVSPEPLTGEARVVAGDALEVALASPADVVVFHGETTVTVTGTGSGGRNQEAALTAAAVLAERVSGLDGSEPAFLAAGTDGIDGPTDAAGAVVDASTVVRGTAEGLDLAECLRNNDSHRYLAAAGDLVTTGPTGTNVGDLWLVARGGI